MSSKDKNLEAINANLKKLHEGFVGYDGLNRKIETLNDNLNNINRAIRGTNEKDYLEGKVAYWIFFKRKVSIQKNDVSAVMRLYPTWLKKNVYRIQLRNGDKYTYYGYSSIFP